MDKLLETEWTDISKIKILYANIARVRRIPKNFYDNNKNINALVSLDPTDTLTVVGLKNEKGFAFKTNFFEYLAYANKHIEVLPGTIISQDDAFESYKKAKGYSPSSSVHIKLDSFWKKVEPGIMALYEREHS